MSKNNLYYLNLSARAHLLGIIPAVITALVLSTFFIVSHNNDQRKVMEDKGQLLADNLTSNSEFEFYTGDKQALNGLLRKSVGKDDIIFAEIYDNNKQIFAYYDINDSNDIEQSKRNVFDETPHLIFIKTFQSSDPTLNQTHDINHGHLRLGISLERYYSIQRKRILTGMLIFIGVLTFAMTITTIVARGVIDPIRRISSVVGSIKGGDLKARSKVNFSDALGELQQDVNSLAQVLQHNQHQQQRFTSDLVISKRNAEVANISKSSFLAMVSHELRTPMNGVFGMLEILESTSLDLEQRDYIDMAKTSSNHLLIIINDILDFSRIESGKFNIEKSFINPSELIDVCIDGFRPGLQNRDINLGVVYLDGFDTIEVEIDPIRFRQILVNLLGNAIKFTREGHVCCVATLIENPGSQSIISVCVEDSGVGIAKEHLAHIFNSFEQADGSTVREFGGTGLGLAISKSLVELLGGKICVESQLNEGSKFLITIPVNIRQIQKVTLDSTDQLKIPTWDINALVVEDNAINQLITRKILERSGIKVETAVNGKLALEACNKKNYDVIFMDCQMPVMDGYEASKCIRDGSLNVNTPIIAVTANAMPQQKKHCYDVGMNDCISKPVSKKAVVDVLQKFFGAD